MTHIAFDSRFSNLPGRTGLAGRIGRAAMPGGIVRAGRGTGFARMFFAPLLAGLLVMAGGAHAAKSADEARYAEPDRLFAALESGVRARAGAEVIVAIDHARLAAAAGSAMPPARVLIWSEPALEAAMLKRQPLAALDLPLRALAYADPKTGRAAVIANSYEFVANRHGLPRDGELRTGYEAAIAAALSGVPSASVAQFASNRMKEPGIVTLRSPHDFATTERKLRAAIDSQGDTVNFGIVDFAARSKKLGVELAPMRLILFGGPGPGGKAMKDAPTLGLDAFCQKLLVWQDASGAVQVSFNDLMALAERQQVSGGIPLRLINWRIGRTFEKALEP